MGSHFAQIINRKHIIYHSNECTELIRYKLRFQKVLNAKVPIIKISDPHTKAQGDISVATFFTKPTIKFIKKFTCFDDRRIKPFILFIKTWSKQRGINDAKNG